VPQRVEAERQRSEPSSLAAPRSKAEGRLVEGTGDFIASINTAPETSRPLLQQRERYGEGKLLSTVQLEPNGEKCGRIFTALSGTLRGEICFSFRLHLARLSTLLFPLPFSPLPERMGCCTASCAGQLSRDAGTEHCSWLLTRNGEVSDNGVQNKTGVLCFLKHSIS